MRRLPSPLERTADDWELLSRVVGFYERTLEEWFTRRELRERLGLGDTQLKVHLARLVSLELVNAHRGAHGAYLYELAWDPVDLAADGVLAPGLIDPEHVYDTDRSGPCEDRSGGGRPRSAGGRGPVDQLRAGGMPAATGDLSAWRPTRTETGCPGLPLPQLLSWSQLQGRRAVWGVAPSPATRTG